MGLFDSLFGKKTNKVEEKYEELDYSDIEADSDSVTIGWEYNANFMLRTPKIYLEYHVRRSNTLEKP